MVDLVSVLEEIEDEITRARAKFPVQDVWITLAALTEEVGELNQAILHLKLEPHKGTTLEDIRKEAVQVATMAIRVILDCDLDKPSKDYKPCICGTE